MQEQHLKDIRMGWATHVSVFVVLLLVLMTAYWETFASLFHLWTVSTDYNHGYLIVAICLYLVWIKRKELAQIKPSVSLLGAVALGGASLLWLLGSVTEMQTIGRVTLAIFVCLTVWASFGTRVLRVLWFPLAYLFFSVPIWGWIGPILQDVTTHVVFDALRAIGVPVLLDGFVFTIPHGQFFVAEVCGGQRYFVAGVALGVLYAYLNYKSLRMRVMFVLVMGVAAVLANWLRVLIVIYVGYKTQMQHSIVHDHAILGWQIFGVMIIPLFWYGVKFVALDTRLYEAGLKTESLDATIPSTSLFHIFSVCLVSLACLILGPLVNFQLHQSALAGKNNEIILPNNINRWSAVDLGDHWQPQYSGADSQARASFTSDKGIVHLYVGRYFDQKQGYELINELNSIADGEVWRLKGGILDRERTVDVWPNSVREVALSAEPDKTRLVWYWYSVYGNETSSPMMAKIYELYRLLGHTEGATIFAIATDYDPENINAGRAVLKSYLIDFKAKVGHI